MNVRSYPFVTVDVFTRRRFGGNQLAVFPEARGLSDADMQALANEFNLSETTFVLPPRDPGADEVFTFEESAGHVEVRVECGADGAVEGATVTAPQPLSLGPEVAVEVVSACTGLESGAVRTGAHAPVVATMGNPFVIAEVEPEVVGRARPDLAAFEWAVGDWPELGGRLALYLYALTVGSSHVPNLHARMFAPLTGTIEDAATGSAATPLAGLLLSLHGAERERFDVIQGAELGRPSLMHAEAWREDGAVRASVGGPCVLVSSGEVTLE